MGCRAETNALDSIGTNHGTLFNGATYTSGTIGGAFQLDGSNDRVGIPDAPELRSASMTIEGWLKYDDPKNYFPSKILLIRGILA